MLKSDMCTFKEITVTTAPNKSARINLHVKDLEFGFSCSISANEISYNFYFCPVVPFDRGVMDPIDHGPIVYSITK